MARKKRPNITIRAKKPTKSKNAKTKKVADKEITLLGGALRSLGRWGGGALGTLIGMPTAGANVGHDLGASISKWLGSGTYTVTNNSCVKMGSDGIPIMHRNGQSVLIRHKEYIGDVVGGTGNPTAFNIGQTFALNPGLASSFPWLSTIAQQFQEYTWKGLVFHFVSTAGMSTSSTNTALGSVMMATNYRATAPAYLNKQQLLNEYFSCDARTTESFCHPIECDPKENPYNVQYVRTSTVPAGEDQKTYDLGVISIATQGMAANNINVGELWATYEIELRKPKTIGTSQADVGLAALNVSAGIGTNAPFGTARTEVIDTIGVTFGSRTLTWPTQVYGVFCVHIQNDTCTTQSLPVITPTNCTTLTNQPFAISYTTLTAATATSAFVTFWVYVPYNTSASSIDMAYTTQAGTSYARVYVMQTSLTAVQPFF